MGTKVSEMITSKYLRKEDIEDELTVSIKGVALETMPGDDQEKRWILYFQHLVKGMVLNTTTIRVLENAYGPDSDDWKGKKVILYVDESVTFKGQVVGGLRLRPIKPPKLQPPAANAAPAFDDAIP